MHYVEIVASLTEKASVLPALISTQAWHHCVFGKKVSWAI